MSKINTVVAGAAILVAAYGGTAWYMGKKAETEIQRQVTEINAALATHQAVNLEDGLIKVNVLSYDRGWLSSNINYEVQVEDEGEQYQFLLADHLRHGPFPFDALRKGQLRPLLAYSEIQLLQSQPVNKWFEATNGALPLHAHSFISFNGSTQSHVALAAVDYQDEDGNRLTTSLAEATIDYDKPQGLSSIVAQLPSLSFLDGENQTQLQLQNTRFTGSLSESPKAQDVLVSWNMHQSVTIDQVGLTLKGSEPIYLNQMAASSSYALNNELLDATLTYELGQLLMGNHDFGQAQLEVAAKRLDYALLAQLSQTEDIDQMDEEELHLMLQQLLAPKPELSIRKLNLTNQAGTSSLTADLHLAATAADDYLSENVELEHYFDVLNLDMALSRAMIQGYFVEESILSSMADMLFHRFAKQGQESGLLLYDGKEAKLALQFDAATQKLMLNGKVLTPEQLAQTVVILFKEGELLF